MDDLQEADPQVLFLIRKRGRHCTCAAGLQQQHGSWLIIPCCTSIHPEPLLSHTSALCPAFCPMQLAQSLRSITGAKDPSAFGLTFMLSLDHLGQSVEVPLGGEAGQLWGWQLPMWLARCPSEQQHAAAAAVWVRFGPFVPCPACPPTSSCPAAPHAMPRAPPAMQTIPPCTSPQPTANCTLTLRQVYPAWMLFACRCSTKLSSCGVQLVSGQPLLLLSS